MTDSEASELRSQVRRVFQSLSPEWRREASLAIAERFCLHFISPGAPQVLALYQSMSDEPQHQPLIDRLDPARHRIVYPEELPTGGLRFPGFEPDQIDVILVPGRVFGEGGERIGRGRGCYDRYLSQCPPGHPLRVALAFDFQVRPTLPQSPWDQSVDWIVTEKREIKSAKL